LTVWGNPIRQIKEEKLAKITIVCETNNVKYLDVRMAQVRGLRTLDEIKAAVNICGECAGCKENMGWILTTVCSCMDVSFEDIVKAIKNGADTVEKVGEVTGAGTAVDCGRCKILIENIIVIGR